MSTEDIKLVAEVLEGIMLSDNNARKEAEKKFETMQTNIPGLIFCLGKIITDCDNLKIKSLAAILLRKIILIKEDQTINKHWEAMNQEYRLTFKVNMLKAFIAEKDKSVKMKICDVVTQVAHNVYESRETWDELLAYISNTLTTTLTETNLIEVESALFLIKSIFAYTHTDILKGIHVLIPVFRTYFTTDILSLKTKTIETICEISSIADKKHTKLLKEFVFSILDTTYKCLQNPKEEQNLKKCLSSLVDVCVSEPAFLSKSFSDLFNLMLKISQNTNFSDENLREIGFEVTCSFVERKKKFFEKDKHKTRQFIEELFKYALEMDEEITEEWAVPKGDSYFDEEVISEEKVASSFSFLDRLLETYNSQFILPFISEIVIKLLENTSDYRYKYVALTSISNMLDHVEEIKDVEKIIPIIFEHTCHENAKIRFASITCITQLSENFEKSFHKDYHEKTFEILVNRVMNDTVLRNKLEACSSLTTLLENIEEEILLNYVGPILENLFSLFLTDIPTCLREIILDVITEIVEVCKDSFSKFAEKSLTILIEFLAKIYGLKCHKSLYGNLINCITMIGPYAKDHYFKFLKDIIRIIVELQDTISDYSDTNQMYFKNTLERITPFLITDFPDTLGSVIGSVIKLIKNVPKMSISDTPKESFKLEDLLAAESEEVKIEKKAFSLSTSETQDVSSAITLLNSLIKTMDKVFLPYVTATEESVFPLLKFYINEEVRIESCNCLPTILTVLKNNCSTEDLHAKAKIYITEVLNACDTEFDNGTLAVFIENMGVFVEIAGLFLNTQELNSFFGKLMIIFDNTEKRRLTLLAEQKKALETPNLKEENINSDDEEDEDDMLKDFEQDIEEIEEIQEYTADIIGILFKTHKELTMEIVKKITSDVLPRYFRSDASIFEIKMGIFIVDDLIEFLGQEILSHIWHDLARIVIGFNTHNSIEIRRAASYGVGVFAKFTKTDFFKYAEDCVNCLYAGLKFTKKENDNEEQFEGAKDNAKSSLGKIIKYQTNNIDVAKIIPSWIDTLPIVHDIDESVEQHLILCQIVTNQSNLAIGENYQNLPKVLKIFARIYNTKNFTSDEIDKNIKTIIKSILNNSVTKNILVHTKDSLPEDDKKLKKKFETFLSQDF